MTLNPDGNQTQKKKKKILLVDDYDCEENHSPFKEKLESEGYEVITAADGEEGWRKVVSERPDLIILDILMKNLDGDQLLWRIRNQEVNPRMKVIVVSGLSDEEEIERIKREFPLIRFWIDKPSHLKDYVQKVRSALGEE